MRLVQIDDLERKMAAAEKALAEITHSLFTIQKALSEYELTTKEPEDKTHPFDVTE